MSYAVLFCSLSSIYTDFISFFYSNNGKQICYKWFSYFDICWLGSSCYTLKYTNVQVITSHLYCHCKMIYNNYNNFYKTIFGINLCSHAFISVLFNWFSPGTPVSSTNKTECNDITEILLRVALIAITLSLSCWKKVGSGFILSLPQLTGEFVYIVHNIYPTYHCCIQFLLIDSHHRKSKL